ncbi:hypothetical protein WJX64_16155 [Leifsonia sp. YIM 134122]|uniref:Pilus assembly protein PilO n=1 Tax=Leifsonia stereocauli TaxID=3134136 RepID=A0ABU9W7W1_9MICO
MRGQNQIWIIGAVLVSVIIVAAGWFLGVSPQLAAARTAETDQQAVEAQNAQLEAELVTLKEDFSHLDELEAQKATLRQALPAEVSMSTFGREIDALAAATGVGIKNVESEDAVPYIPPVGAASVAPQPIADAEGDASASGDEASGEPTEEPAAPVAAPVPTVPGGTAVAPMPYSNDLVTAAGLLAVPVTIEVTGGQDQLLAFLKAIQFGSRQLSVSTAVRAETQASDLTPPGLKITGYIWVLPEAAVPVAADPTATAG